jgi:myo-inositol-1(or 4)-monophosphatase
MHPMLNIAVRAARAAGNLIIRQIDQARDLPASEKSRNDFVTEVDRQAEDTIIDTLLKAYPKHAILAEESGARGESEYIWIIDPLDGTTNFMHGFPHFAISIALQHRGVLQQAVIYDPLRQELFTASRGDGAYLNDRRIRVSKRKDLKGALLGTGFPFREGADIERFICSLKALAPATAGIRRAGAATLDLAYVACGRLDGFWEFGLKPWDMAAGALLIEESGGLITDINGGKSFMESGNVLSAPPGVHEQVLRLFGEVLK